MPVTEIAWFKSTKTYQNDHSLTAETARRLIQLDGLHEIYFGFQHEDPTIAYVLNIWESYGHYEAANKHESYAETFATFQPALEGTFQDISVVLAETPSIPKLKEAVTAGITEIVVTQLKEGGAAVVPSLIEAIDASPHLFGHSWGPVRGKEGEYVLVVGWASREAHSEAARTGKIPDVIERGAKTLSNARIAHAKFWKAA
ncbi:hypothetical protein Moror_1950 [Moniliophthora roreri MCA 2997]|uniref:ABM domain-containing protein n=1 Tax=Moniliophthora roreri (strain MCA 2997) TaxID=1381753 RepID=V2X198_MONRO|nr:hypothetical protein Moror_1950 [Moniliophthora roreri MCA 2997]